VECIGSPLSPYEFVPAGESVLRLGSRFGASARFGASDRGGAAGRRTVPWTDVPRYTSQVPRTSSQGCSRPLVTAELRRQCPVQVVMSATTKPSSTTVPATLKAVEKPAVSA
jgi:hypothetical protein